MSIDAQFNRAVDIVQSLPKGGPVQTSYEEKLCLYSLYKQATEGNIAAPRPGMLDMLGRAKWDSWNKQKGTDKSEAKRRYVAALLKILRKHAGQKGIQESIDEIESFEPYARAPSPASSTSSYHSSQASPPSFLPPNPQSPIPDVAPDIIPPSALNSSHRSLLNLLSSTPAPSEPFNRGTGSVVSDGRKGSVSSVRYIRQPPETRPSGSRPYSPLMPAVRELDGNLLATPVPHHLNPAFQGTPSTYSHQPPGIPQSLQQIQLSLTALHERLSTLERTQAMLIRRSGQRWRLFGWNEADELDEIEDEAYGWQRTATRRPSFKFLWAMITTIRRAMVDLSVGGIVLFVILAIGGARVRRTLRRLYALSQRLIQ